MLPFVFRAGPRLTRGGLACFVAVAVWLGAILSGGYALAHGGHDHGDTPAPSVATAQPRVSAASDAYELVAVLRGERLAIFLDRFATNEPITDAAIAVTIGEGDAVNAEAAGDGTYTVASPRFGEAGAVELVFAITSKSGDDLLLGTLTLPERAAPVAAAPAAAPPAPLWEVWQARMPIPLRDPVVLALATFGLGILFGLLLRGGRLLPFAATAATAAGVLVLLVGAALGAETALAPGLSDTPQRLPDGSVFVPKPTQRLLDVRTVLAKPEQASKAVNLIGRIIADPNRGGVVQSISGGRVIAADRGLPRIGQTVRKGEILALIERPLPPEERVTLSEKTGELEQQVYLLEAKLKRLRPLAERGVTAQSQVIDAEVELEGLRRRREIIRSTRAEAEELRAPADGVIASARAAPGQVVQAQDVLFQIVDPKGLWIEALVYGDLDPASLAEASAVAVGGQSLRLTFQGFSRTLQQQAAVVQFAVQDPPANVSVGQPVTVVAKNGAPVTGLVLPRDAVVRGASGEAIVWRHAEPERFQARPVRVEPFDAARVLVVGGVEEGERIVVRAAELVNQIR